MQTNVQKLKDARIELKIDVPAEEFKSFIDKAVLEMGKNVEVQGFRKGKAPKDVIEKHLGQDKILQYASEDCVRENYVKAVKEQKLEPLGQPEIEISKMALGNPFEFKATFQVLPEIKLPDYRKLASKIEKKEIKVTEQELEKLKKEKERIEKDRRRQEILEKIAEKAEMEVPQILVEAEQKRMLDNIKQQVPQMLQITFEDYLKKVSKTEKELLDTFLPDAQKRVKNSLILREIEKQENIKIEEKELEEEMQKISQGNSSLDKSQLKEYTESVIRSEKTLELLENL